MNYFRIAILPHLVGQGGAEIPFFLRDSGVEAWPPTHAVPIKALGAPLPRSAAIIADVSGGLAACLKMGFLLHTITGAVRSSRKGYSAKVWHWHYN